MANAVVGALNVVLGIDTAAFRDGLNNATKDLKRVGAQMQSVGQSLSLYVTAPLVGFGALAARTAGEFEQSMNRVAAVSGATGDEFEKLGTLAKDLGATTQFSASDAANAMGFLAMAGFRVNEIMEALPGTLQLASSAQMDMATSADIVSNVLSGYGMEVSELARVNDVLVKAFTASNTNLQQLGEAMQYAGPVASAAGVGFEEATAALGMMGNAGIQASMAGTSLRGAISRILAPTKAMRSAMDEAGLSFTDASGKIRPLAEIIEELEPHAEDAGLFMELFGQRAGPAMAALVSQGSDALRELTGELENSAGTAERVGSVQMQGFNGAMRELESAFESLQIALAESGLLEFLADMATKLANGIRYLSETDPKLLKFATVIAGVGAAIGPVLVGLGLMATAIGAIGIPVAAVIAGITGLTAAVVAFWPELIAAKDAVIAFGTDALDWITAKVEEIPAIFRAIPEAMGAIGIDIIEGLWEGITGRWDALKGRVAGIADSITGVFRGVWDTHSPSRVFADLGGNLMEGLALGIGASAGAVKSDVSSLADSIGNAFADILRGASDFRSALSDILGSIGGGLLNAGISGLTGALGIPMRAMGGPVSARSPYIVGERGPELFVPKQSGDIIPNHDLGGTTRVEVVLSPDLQARILDAAGQQSVAISQQAVRGYDQALPQRVRSIEGDRRFLGSR